MGQHLNGCKQSGNCRRQLARAAARVCVRYYRKRGYVELDEPCSEGCAGQRPVLLGCGWCVGARRCWQEVPRGLPAAWAPRVQ